MASRPGRLTASIGANHPTGAKRRLNELRELSRGIHPAVLSEGALGPALKVLARRSVVPVELEVDVGDGCPDGSR